jgi:hypothetical protein
MENDRITGGRRRSELAAHIVEEKREGRNWEGEGGRGERKKMTA